MWLRPVLSARRRLGAKGAGIAETAALLAGRLEAKRSEDALRILNESLVNEIKVLEIRKEIAGQAASEMSKSQREYLLRQQLRAIHAELGEGDPQQQEAAARSQDYIGEIAK